MHAVTTPVLERKPHMSDGCTLCCSTLCEVIHEGEPWTDFWGKRSEIAYQTIKVRCLRPNYGVNGEITSICGCIWTYDRVIKMEA